MKLHTVMVTFNRLESTKQSIASFLETVTVPFTLVVVDNGSTDGTEEWLLDSSFSEGGPPIQANVIALGENRYPGYACNQGWARAPDDATHLQRADNDWTFLPGWCDQVRKAFKDPKVGQVGLRTDTEEAHNGVPIPWNVGGNNIIRRELWDQGLRYDERPWTALPAGHSEDTYLSPAVAKMGYEWQRVAKPCIVGNSGPETEKDEYYRRSWGARRIYGLKPMKDPK